MNRYLNGLLVLSALGLLWWTISEGRDGSWLVGAPTVSLAAVVLARTGAWPVLRFRAWVLPRFGAWFVWQSIRGGLDVARRVVGREIHVRPRESIHDWRLPEGGLRTLAIALINLQPGTLVVSTDAHRVYLHVLDEAMSSDVDIDRIEQRVGELAGRSSRPYGSEEGST